MSKKYCFDVIFSNENLQQNVDEFKVLIQNQESGSEESVCQIRGELETFKARLGRDLGSKFYLGFGYSITSATLSAAAVLPKRVLASTVEFPPIHHGFQSMGMPVEGLLDMTHASYLPVEGVSDWSKEVLLLLSHVSYLDGSDLLGSQLEELLDSNPPLKEVPIHLVIDGAHAIGNHFMVKDIPALEQRCRKLMNIQSFTYIFDLYKWIQGIMGMSIVVSTNPRIPQNIGWIFPNLSSYDTSHFSFETPVSVSFNPVLMYWLLNLHHYCGRLFDDLLPTRNEKITEYFLSVFRENQELSITASPATNLLSLTTADPIELYRHLSRKELRVHLMGGRRMITRKGIVTIAPQIRLAFHGDLATRKDVDYLIATLKQWRYSQKKEGAYAHY